MPTNLPPECTILEKKYLEAETTSEKIDALENYLAAIPKHKGTERLCARIKTKIAKLRLEEEKKKRRKGQSIGSKYAIKKAGAAQLVLLGFTGSGKSSLLKALTNANPEIHRYLFTTTEPIPGMMIFEDIQIQLVEAPALYKGASDGTGWGPRVLNLARNADGLIIVVDLSKSNPHSQLKTIIEELNKGHIIIERIKAKVVIQRKEAGGIQVVSFGKLINSIHQVKTLLQKMKIEHAVIKIWGEVHLNDIAQAILHEQYYKPTIVIANKIDVIRSKTKFMKLKEITSLNLIAASAISKKGFEEIPKLVFESLKITRVYTKKPRQKPSKKPIIMEAGSTVGDVAKMIHKDFYREFKYAKLWGSSKYPGERVGLTYTLNDKDILEIHI